MQTHWSFHFPSGLVNEFLVCPALYKWDNALWSIMMLENNKLDRWITTLLGIEVHLHPFFAYQVALLAVIYYTSSWISLGVSEAALRWLREYNCANIKRESEKLNIGTPQMLGMSVLRSQQTLTPWGREFRSVVCYVVFHCIPIPICMPENVTLLSIRFQLETIHFCPAAHYLYTQVSERTNRQKSWWSTDHRDLCFPSSDMPNSACEASDNELMSSIKHFKWGRMINCAIMWASKPKRTSVIWICAHTSVWLDRAC